MNMSDVFNLPVSCEEVAEIGTEIFLGNEDAYAAHAINNHDRLVNLLDMFDRYQGSQDDYLNSPFCAEVRECLFANGACQDDERPKEKANEIHDKLTERVKEFEVENEALKSGLRIIADPVAYLEEQARFFGNEFKSTAAVSLSRDSDWLKGIARQLLEKE